MVQEVGLSLREAIKLTTVNPARFMRLDGDRGSLLPGKRADLVLLDDTLAVRMTIVGGHVVYDRKAAAATEVSGGGR